MSGRTIRVTKMEKGTCVHRASKVNRGLLSEVPIHLFDGLRAFWERRKMFHMYRSGSATVSLQ
jgi:hypothetical protein